MAVSVSRSRELTIPRALQEVISTALEKDRDLRYQSAAEIRAELKRIRRDAGSGRAPRARVRPPARVIVLRSIGAQVLQSSGTAPTPTSGQRGCGRWACGNAGAARGGRLLGLPPFAAAASPPDRRDVDAGDAADDKRQRVGGCDVARRTLRDLRAARGRQAESLGPSGGHAQRRSGACGGRSRTTRSLVPPDGDYVYSCAPTASPTTYSSAYSMPVLGGTPRQLVRDVDTAVTFSPDGQRLAFVRGVPDAGKARLLIANVDGTAEQRSGTLTLRSTLGEFWRPIGLRTAGRSRCRRQSVASAR